mmetsp:Transcript_86130/g.180160  ORF Transcript_86130/g.180160 Transcript_86130/m.180160 type:complete len:82 (+) Transcript_86130:173-418(+)
MLNGKRKRTKNSNRKIPLISTAICLQQLQFLQYSRGCKRTNRILSTGLCITTDEDHRSRNFLNLFPPVATMATVIGFRDAR